MTATRWSLQAVERIAPDASSLAAGRRLAAPGPWSGTGASDTLVWGRCQGSGREPYLVSVDVSGPAYRCSCPSRKHPCKHAIALLLLWARGDGALDAAGTPDVARSWAQTRATRAASAATAASAAPAKPVDEEARAKRLAERLALMDAGVEDFAQWLTDLARGGFVAARRSPYAWWDAAAARLVDAQLPGLAERVRETGVEVGRRPDWADLLLDEVGRWWLTVGAWRRRLELDERTRADLRVAVGWATPTEEVRTADAVEDHWQVLGVHRSDDGRLQQQRTWLRGIGTDETVLVLDYAARAGGNPLPAARLIGSVLDATLARYPGSAPRRALFATEPAVVSLDAALPPGETLGVARRRLVDVWGRNPWAARVPTVLSGATVSGGQVRDAEGAAVAVLPTDDPWSIPALTGGRPADLFGELEAAGFRPLAVGLDEHGEVR